MQTTTPRATSVQPSIRVPLTTDFTSPAWQSAQVIQVHPTLVVQPTGEFLNQDAKLAASALLQPQPGDRVLLAWCDGQCWVVSVLELRTSGPAQISVPCTGTLTISHPSLQFHASQRLNVQTHALHVDAQTTRAHLGVTKVAARAIQVAAERVSLWAELVQTRAQSLLVRAEQRVTKIDQADLLQAGNVVTEVDHLMQLKACHIQAKAQETVLMDGKQILMG